MAHRTPFQIHGLRVLLPMTAAAALLAGCAQNLGGPDSPRVYDPSLRTEAEQQLAQSSSRAASALETLALVQRARTPVSAPLVDEEALPEELRAKSTVEFSGPAAGILRDLARQVGYGFFEVGNAPSNPVLVNVVARDQAVGRVLADVGLQVQRVATVVVDPNSRRIELRHEAGFTPRAARPARAGQAPRTRQARAGR